MKVNIVLPFLVTDYKIEDKTRSAMAFWSCEKIADWVTSASPDFFVCNALSHLLFRFSRDLKHYYSHRLTGVECFEVKDLLITAEIAWPNQPKKKELSFIYFLLCLLP